MAYIHVLEGLNDENANLLVLDLLIPILDVLFLVVV